MTFLSNIARSEGDPRVLRSGPSSLAASDRLAKAMGWFSFALGFAELAAPHRITRALGMEGHEGLVRAYGAREIGAGFLSLSVDKQLGLWSRVAGDVLDIATLLVALRPGNRKRENVAVALAFVVGATILDVVGATGATVRHSRNRGERRLYTDRSGFPGGIQAAKGAAKKASDTPANATAASGAPRASGGAGSSKSKGA